MHWIAIGAGLCVLAGVVVGALAGYWLGSDRAYWQGRQDGAEQAGRTPAVYRPHDGPWSV